MCVCVRSMCVCVRLCVCVCVCVCVCLVLYQNSNSDELPSVMHIPGNRISFVSELQQHFTAQAELHYAMPAY